jgi:PIN domain nuclease of toxin-antitoxin system
VRQALAQRLEVRPVSAEIALDAASLDRGFPGDPADRIIYATARRERALLVTKDTALRRLDPRLTVW